MRMARKLRNKELGVTCPAEFRPGRSPGALETAVAESPCHWSSRSTPGAT